MYCVDGACLNSKQARFSDSHIEDNF